MSDSADLYTLERLSESLTVRHGRPVAGTIKLYSVMRNERFFLDAFFSHYRNLGVQQFLILDDGSSDGSLDFLAGQPDCVLLASPLRYGDRVRVRMPDRRKTLERAGVLFKRVIPEKYCRGEYTIYADADEFLILPEQVDGLDSLFRVLAEHDVDSVAASLIEFYPDSMADLRGQPEPRTFDDLVALYPWFDAVPLLRFRQGMQPKRINGSASRRLFRRYGLVRQRPRPAWMPRWVQDLRRPLPGKSATLKTPILRWREGVWTTDTHHANVPPASEILLAFAHFKFTHTWARKTEEALRLRSYAANSEKYELYARLIEHMKADTSGFRGPHSRHFQGPHDLAEAGLLHCRWG